MYWRIAITVIVVLGVVWNSFTVWKDDESNVYSVYSPKNSDSQEDVVGDEDDNAKENDQSGDEEENEEKKWNIASSEIEKAEVLEDQDGTSENDIPFHESDDFSVDVIHSILLPLPSNCF